MTRAGGLPQHELTAQLLRITDELADKFHGVFGRETVERFVDETYALLNENATVKTHLATLTARFAKQRLHDYGRAQGLTKVEVPQVLFICVHNVGRSQMASALLEHHAFGKIAVRSAGSQPSGSIPSQITEVLAELNIPLTQAFPKPLTDEVVRAADVVVTMGCGDSCPVYPGKRYLDWEVADPVGAPLHRVREVRDDIDRRVRSLLSELLGD
ncbi:MULTISPECIES: arsenate reductase ArsC [Lentzea]|uniref:Protein-tyrosine-phosphatase n=3 Tax=Lentzea TaxID=165301 RepID=A0A1W2AMA0_9PSEU|nr:MULTISPECIES: arsenate reductase ArsC [Lentzea]MDX8149919.1 arsenate reductase ArsC [Lentzea sp. BCCO 10_0061]SDN06933.1 Protein-tyrosine-phosphatase [Lentzea albidocapillata subsp. violacea]SMC61348.1 Protein-tyrosine-phosphatase [Lentzea albidocapillata]